MNLPNERFDPDDYNDGVAESLADDGVPHAIKWAMIFQVLLRRWAKDPYFAVGELIYQWELSSRFNEYFAQFVDDESEDRADRMAAAFDEYLAEFVEQKPF